MKKALCIAAIMALIGVAFTTCDDKTNDSDPKLSYITANYLGTATIYTSTPINDLKTGLTVTAYYDNNTNKAVTDYTLNGTLAVGTSTIIVNYQAKDTTFDVTVTAVILNSITANYIGTDTIYKNTPLDNLKLGLIVTAFYSNSTSEPITGYLLSGTLTVGTSTITVNYQTKDTTFDVTVEANCECLIKEHYLTCFEATGCNATDCDCDVIPYSYFEQLAYQGSPSDVNPPLLIPVYMTVGVTEEKMNTFFQSLEEGYYNHSYFNTQRPKVYGKIKEIKVVPSTGSITCEPTENGQYIITFKDDMHYTIIAGCLTEWSEDGVIQ